MLDFLLGLFLLRRSGLSRFIRITLLIFIVLFLTIVSILTIFRFVAVVERNDTHHVRTHSVR